jgi:hypothetical protein
VSNDRLPDMEAAITPRVNFGYLGQYVGRNVMLVGRVVQLRGETAVLDADGQVTVHLDRVSSAPHLPPSDACC